MDEVRVYELKKKDLTGATVIEGFPSVGLVSSIAGNYLINALGLEHIGVLDSPDFPAVSVIRNSEPLNPVRIYANNPPNRPDVDPEQVVVFVSEFQPPTSMVKEIASTMLDWIQEQKCSLLISPEGLIIDRGGSEEGEETEEHGGSTKTERINDIGVYGVASNKRARKIIMKHGIKDFQQGVVSGVAGVLLNESKRRDFDTICILAEANPNYPDARAAAKVIEVIDKILIHTHIDVKPLYDEAKNIEIQLKNMHKQVKNQTKAAEPQMYT